MAKTIATVSGVALAPGVSKNGRLYTREAIAKAVTRAQGRITDGAEPLTILTHHEAGDDSSRIIGRITNMSIAGDGSARFTASIADTPHAQAVASLIDTSGGGDPFLKGMSIRGAWIGKVRRAKGPSGDPVETADDLEFYGVDPTHKPGVPTAGIDAFAWAKGGASETTERVAIYESLQEARVTSITEETARLLDTADSMPPEGVREALRAVFGAGPDLVTEGGNAPGDGSKPFGNVSYADPGYQKDGQKRYPLDTAAHAKSAWSYINQAKNAGQYTAAQLKRVKGRIKAAAGKFGIKIASEGWTVDPAFQVTEAVAEFYGADTEQLAGAAGSYSLTASNGPTTVTVCSYGLDPADLAVILAKACEGAGNALASLDPDMDGDIDVPGADAEDTDGDMGGGGEDTDGDGISDLATRLAAAMRGESTEDPEALITETRALLPAAETAPVEPPAPDAGPTQREEPAVSEATTTEAVVTPAAPAATPTAVPAQDVIDAAVAKALTADREARKARKAAKAAAAPAPAETAPAAPAPVAETTVTEPADERITRLVEEKLAAINAPSPSAVTETEDQRVERLVQEALVREKQTLATQGAGPGRKGLVTEHTAAAAAAGEIPADLPYKDGKVTPMEQWGEAEYRAVGRVWQDHVLGDRAVY